RGRDRRDVRGTDRRVRAVRRGVPLPPPPVHQDAARGGAEDLQVRRAAPLDPGQRAQPLPPSLRLPIPPPVPPRPSHLFGDPAAARPGRLLGSRYPRGGPSQRLLLPRGGPRDAMTDGSPLLEVLAVEKR